MKYHRETRVFIGKFQHMTIKVVFDIRSMGFQIGYLNHLPTSTNWCRISQPSTVSKQETLFLGVVVCPQITRLFHLYFCSCVQCYHGLVFGVRNPITSRVTVTSRSALYSFMHISLVILVGIVVVVFCIDFLIFL